MRLRRSVAAIAVTFSAALALPSSAPARKAALAGQTAEGVAVELRIAQSGNATSFEIGRTQVSCQRGGTLTIRPTTFDDFDRSDPGSFAGHYRRTYRSGGYRLLTKTKLSGSAKSNGSWTGTYRTKTAVIDQGESTDVCRLKTRWRAG